MSSVNPASAMIKKKRLEKFKEDLSTFDTEDFTRSSLPKKEKVLAPTEPVKKNPRPRLAADVKPLEKSKNTYILPDYMTDRPLKDHEGLAALRNSLEQSEKRTSLGGN